MRSLLRLVLCICCFLCGGSWSVAQISGAVPNAIGADSPGFTLEFYAYNAAPTAVCFYTGYGSTAPIAPKALSTYLYSIVLPASTIQAVPKALITPGTFNAQLYSVKSLITPCTGVAGVSPVAVPILPPTAMSTRVKTLPQRNSSVAGTYAPTQIYLDGNGLSTSQTATFSGAFTSFTGPVNYISPTQVEVDAPVVPAGVSTVNVTLCSTGPSNYCSAPVSYGVNALFTLPASLSATQNSTYSYSLEADFGNSASPAGVPLGPVTFQDAGATIGTVTPNLTALHLNPALTPGTWTTSGGGSVQSVVADFDKDGIPDVLVYDSATPSLFHLLYGTDNHGNLNKSLDLSAGSSSGCGTLTGFAVADFNNDGYQDFAALCTSYGSSAVYVYTNQRDGTFSSSAIYLSITATAITAGDMDKDGNADIVVVGYNPQVSQSGAFTILLGDGTGAFPKTKTTGTGVSGDNIVAVDLNKSGYLDLVTIVKQFGIYSIFANDKTGGFGRAVFQQETDIPYGQLLVQHIAGQYPNLLITELSNPAQKNPPSVFVLQNSGGFNFAQKSGFNAPNLQSATVGDFNGDGNDDVAYFDGSKINVYSSDSNANFTSTIAGTPLSPQPITASKLILAGSADLNADGYADLYVTGTASTQATAFAQAYAVEASVAARLPNQVFVAGNHPLTATSPGSITYAPATATTSFTITTPVTASLTVNPASSPTFSPSGMETLVAEYDSTAPINSFVTFMDGNKVLGQAQMMQSGANRYLAMLTQQLTAGTHALSFMSSGESTLPGASTTYIVLKGQPVLTWTPNPSTIAYGTQLSAAQLDAVAQVGGTTIPGTYLYTPVAGTTPNPGRQTLAVSFTPTDTVDYNSPVNGTANIVVTFTPRIVWPAPGGIVYRTPLSAAQLDATAVDQNGASIAGIFTYTPALGTILAAGVQPLSVSFAPSDGTTYTNATGSNSITVARATPTINWSTPASITVGTALSATQLNATAAAPDGTAVAGSFVYTPGSGTVLPAGTTTLNAVFTPADTANYNSGASASVMQVVSRATTALSASGSPSPSTYGQPITLGATLTTAPGATAPSGSVSFSEGPNPLGSAPVQGGAASLPIGTLTAGRHFLTASYSGDANYGVITQNFVQVVNPAATLVRWTAPSGIVYGTALTAAQLNATAVNGVGAAVAGTYTYVPALGTILTAGPQNLQVSFQPGDTLDYLNSAGSTLLQVAQAVPTIKWATPAPITSGVALGATQLNASFTGVNGATLPGTPTYNPPAGTVLAPGSRTLSVSFAPSDTVNYQVANASVTLVVNSALTTVMLTGGPNPATYGQPVTFTATVTPANASLTPTGSVAFLDAGSPLGSITPTNGVATLSTSTLRSGTHTITAMYAGDSNSASSTSAPLSEIVNPVNASLTWAAPAGITYGMLLSATQLNATATDPTGIPIPGTYVYTPAAGTLLTAGTQTLSVMFTPTDSVNATSSTARVSIVVSKATPAVQFAMPADVIAGTALSATQLNATATGIAGPLAGTFTYTPPLGTVVGAGKTTLTVSFTPTDQANYTSPANASVTLNGTPLTLTAVSVTSAVLGDPAKTITLTGTGFVSSSVVSADGSTVPTTFVNGTTLTAVLPAAVFTTVHSISVLVNDPAQAQTTGALTIAVAAAPLTGTLVGPTITTVGAQPVVSFNLAAPYPVPLTVTFQLSFVPGAGLPNDPTVLFSNGTTIFTVVIPAGTTVIPNLQLQSGSVQGAIILAATFSAGGASVNPSGPATLTINEPAAVPGASDLSLSQGPNSITITIHGYSNIRAISSVRFHFIAVPGQNLDTTDLNVDGSTLFAPYYASTLSQAYGSTFTYTQTFDLHGGAYSAGQVQVTLVNSVGNSTTYTVQ